MLKNMLLHGYWMNKRGAELPLTTLIVIILVVIVLIVVATFFLGGTSSLSRSIRNVFYGTTAGTDLSLAREICAQRCENARGLTLSAAKATVYCTATFSIDNNNDGKVEGTGETDIKCDNSPISNVCNIVDAGKT